MAVDPGEMGKVIINYLALVLFESLIKQLNTYIIVYKIRNS